MIHKLRRDCLINPSNKSHPGTITESEMKQNIMRFSV